MGITGRTTRFKAGDGFVYKVEIVTMPGKILKKRLVISESQCGYLRSSTVHNPYNTDKEVVVYLSLQDKNWNEMMSTLVNPLTIRDSAEIILYYRDERVTFESIKGNIIARSRHIIKLRECGKKFMLFGKQKLDEARRKVDRLITKFLAPDQPLLANL